MILSMYICTIATQMIPNDIVFRASCSLSTTCSAAMLISQSIKYQIFFTVWFKWSLLHKLREFLKFYYEF